MHRAHVSVERWYIPYKHGLFIMIPFQFWLLKLLQLEFERAGEVDKDLYGTVILEHRCRVDDQDEGMKYRHDIVGCVLYTNMYHALKGKTYFIQGLYVLPHLKGKVCLFSSCCKK